MGNRNHDLPTCSTVPLKDGVQLNNVSEFSSYLAYNTLHPVKMYPSTNAGYGLNMMLSP